MSWDNWYKVLLTVLLSGIAAWGADIWAGVVVAVAMCLAWLIAARIKASREAR